MLTKLQCLPDTQVIVNDKKTEWNKSCGCEHNGLHAQTKIGDFFSGTQYEFIPGTIITIVSKLKRLDSSKYVQFKVKNVEGIDENTIFVSFWITFKYKVNIYDTN